MKRIILSLVGVALMLIAVHPCLGQVIDIGDAKDFSRSLAVAPGGTLTMNLDRGGVHITGADQKAIEIRVQRTVTHASDSDATNILREEHVTIKQMGNGISIASDDPPSLRRASSGSWWGGGRANLEVYYEITVPRQFDVRVETSGGNLALDSLHGDVNVKTEGGQLKFSDIEGNIDGATEGGDVLAEKCHGQLRVKTEGGQLRFADIDGNVDGQTEGGNVSAGACRGELRLKTEGGNINIADFTGPDIRASTEGGSVSADLVVAPKADSSLDTSGGNVTVRLPDNAAVNLDASTEGGVVKTDLPVQVEGTLSGNRLKGTVHGGGPLLSLKTEGGNIEVLKR